MARFTRYAVYFTPPPGALADFAARWLGWDPVAGAERPAPDLPGLPQAAHDLTATPRKYGFHATVKPPFRLPEGQDPEALEQALRELCARLRPLRLDGLAVAELGAFLALRPLGPEGALNALCAQAVTELDQFRSPASAAEMARRRAAGLSPEQERMLQEWGYPYVVEGFRFHLTLTDALPDGERAQVAAVLSERLGPLLPRPFVIDALSLCGEAEDGRFHLLHRVTLTGSGREGPDQGTQ